MSVALVMSEKYSISFLTCYWIENRENRVGFFGSRWPSLFSRDHLSCSGAMVTVVTCHMAGQGLSLQFQFYTMAGVSVVCLQVPRTPISVIPLLLKNTVAYPSLVAARMFINAIIGQSTIRDTLSVSLLVVIFLSMFDYNVYCVWVTVSLTLKGWFFRCEIST